jgi:hypothetical protein
LPEGDHKANLVGPNRRMIFGAVSKHLTPQGASRRTGKGQHSPVTDLRDISPQATKKKIHRLNNRFNV